MASKARKIIHTASPLVLPLPPKATSPSTIKGVPGAISQYFFASRPGSPALLRKNKWFRCTFFPAEHIGALFRKSSPAMRVRYLYGTLLNDPQLPKTIKSKFAKSVDAFDYAHIRVDLRRMYRELMWKHYEGADGMYVFDAVVVPRPDEWAEVELEVKRAMTTAKTVDWDDKTRQANAKVNWWKVRSILRNEGLPVPEGLDTLAETKTSGNARRNHGGSAPPDGQNRQKKKQHVKKNHLEW